MGQGRKVKRVDCQAQGLGVCAELAVKVVVAEGVDGEGKGVGLAGGYAVVVAVYGAVGEVGDAEGQV